MFQPSAGLPPQLPSPFYSCKIEILEFGVVNLFNAILSGYIGRLFPWEDIYSTLENFLTICWTHWKMFRPSIKLLAAFPILFM
jgi:hypothetical protein